MCNDIIENFSDVRIENNEIICEICSKYSESLFAEECVAYWMKHGHRLAEKVWGRAEAESLVLKRLRNDEEKNYTNLVYLFIIFADI